MKKDKTLILREAGQLHIYFKNTPHALYGDGAYDWMCSLSRDLGGIELDWNDSFVPELEDIRLIYYIAENFDYELSKAPKDYFEPVVILPPVWIQPVPKDYFETKMQECK